MKSPVVKRSIMIGSHKTSVSLEEAFWDGLKEISRERGKTLSELISEIDERRQQSNLSSAIRLFCSITFGQVPQAQLTYPGLPSNVCLPSYAPIIRGSSPDAGGSSP